MNALVRSLVVLVAMTCSLRPVVAGAAQAPVPAANAGPASLDEARRLTWQTDTRAAGIAALRAIATGRPEDVEARFELGRVLTWNVVTRAEGVTLLRGVLEQSPHHVDAAEALADVLSWDTATRDDAVRRLRSLVDREPSRTSARLKLAEVLSWSPATRDESIAIYRGVLHDDAGSVAATVGLARVLSWSGRIDESRQWYRRALVTAPGERSATVGIAELETWTGRSRSALKTLDAADAGTDTPDALRLRAEAYSQIGRPARALQEYERLLAMDPGHVEAGRAAQLLKRDLRPAFEIGTETSTESGDPMSSQVEGTSVPIRFVFRPNGGDATVSVIGSQTQYRNRTGSSRDRFGGVAAEVPAGNRVRVTGEVVSHEFDRADRAFTGRGELLLAAHDAFDVRAGFAREQLSSSRLSLVGEQAGGIFYGPSFVDQLLVGFSARPARGWDGWVQSTMGRLRGSNIADNARREVFAGAGRSVRPGKATLRFGYGLTWMSYDRDLGGFPATDRDGDGLSAPGVGGYFSPALFLNHTARIDATVPVNEALVLVGGAGVGRQLVEESRSRGFATFTPSSDAYFGVRSRVVQRLSVGTNVTYQDVASAYNRTVIRVTLSYQF